MALRLLSRPHSALSVRKRRHIRVVLDTLLRVDTPDAVVLRAVTAVGEVAAASRTLLRLHVLVAGIA